MPPRLLPVLFSALLYPTQAFLAPVALTSRGESRCLSSGPHEEPWAHSGRRALVSTSATVAPDQRHRATGAVSMSFSGDSCNRGGLFSEMARGAAGLGLAVAVAPSPASAKQAEAPPVNWKDEFGSVKEATDLVLSDLRNLTNKGEWGELMEQAKGYDQSIRKGLMGNVRKKMPKELKGDAMTYRNNVTFDLIAVNKAARVEDKSKALEVLDILESDIKDFLNLEKRI
eukprot:g13166.t1